MSQQMYGKRREEPYSPSYGYGQGSNFVQQMRPFVETKQSEKKPVFIDYYPSGNTNNPQRVIAEVETVTREVVKNPGEMIDPMKETRNHYGDGQVKREDKFINKLRDETIKATADLNNASRIIEPKVLSTNLDQLQLSEQPRNRHRNGTSMNDGWIEAPDSVDPNHPRKVVEIMNRVSNWRGVNGGAKPISSDGYNKLGYGINRDYSINYGLNKMPNVTQGYDYMGYGGETKRTIPPRSEDIGYYNGNRGGTSDEVYTRRNDIMNVNAPRASGGGYSSDPLLTQKVRYDDIQRNPNSMDSRYTTYGSGYNSGMGNHLGYNNGQLEKVAEYDQVYGNAYNSGSPRSNYVERPVNGGATASGTTVITSIDAVTKYKGTFVPMRRNEEQRKQIVPLRI